MAIKLLITILNIFLVIGFVFVSANSTASEEAVAIPDIDFVHPNMFLNTGEIEAIKEKVRNNREPWKTAYISMMSEADSSLNTPIQSVTFGGKTPPSGDRHDYYSDIAYLRDGVYDPNADRTDYISALKMRKSVRALGLAYVFTGDSRYANKGLQLIKAWAIDPTTKMNPKFTTFNDMAHIELTITMPAVFYGADLIWNYPGWNPEDKIAFQSWSRDFIVSAKSWSRNHNFDLWRLVFIGSAAVIAEDGDSLQYVFDRWKFDLGDQLDSQGKIFRELYRATSLSYSISGVNGFMHTAELARHYGVDLYHYRTSDDKDLELTLDFHAPYIANPSTWTYGDQTRPYQGENSALYELAYSFVDDKTIYMNVINKWRRPMYEDRTLGPVTLTHAIAGLGPIITPTPTPLPTSPTPTLTPTPTPIITSSPIGGPNVICYVRRR